MDGGVLNLMLLLLLLLLRLRNHVRRRGLCCEFNVITLTNVNVLLHHTTLIEPPKLHQRPNYT